MHACMQLHALAALHRFVSLGFCYVYEFLQSPQFPALLAARLTAAATAAVATAAAATTAAAVACPQGGGKAAAAAAAAAPADCS